MADHHSAFHRRTSTGSSVTNQAHGRRKKKTHHDGNSFRSARYPVQTRTHRRRNSKFGGKKVKLITGDLWTYYGRENYVVLITTNGNVKKNGKAVLGRGCAKEATLKIPGIEKLVGASIQNFGNVPFITDRGYGTFPVKHNWWEPADLKLIAASAEHLKKFIAHPDFAGKTFILGRPGCGSGGLQWEEVKPILETCNLPNNVWIISRSHL